MHPSLNISYLRIFFLLQKGCVLLFPDTRPEPAADNPRVAAESLLAEIMN